MKVSRNEARMPLFRTKFFVFLCSGLIILSLAPQATPVAYVALSIHALRGPKEVIQALALLSILLLINTGLVSGSGAASLRWLVLFAAFGRVLWDSIVQKVPSPSTLIRPLFVLSLSLFVLAVLSSYAPKISVLKLTSFTIGTYTILTAFHRTLNLCNYWASWFTTLFLFVLFASAPLYVVGPGFLRAPGSFQGILNHPQAFGPVAAAITAWLTALFLYGMNRSRPVEVGLLIGWVGIFTAHARTGLVMAVGGLALTFLIGKIRERPWRLQLATTFSALGLLAAVLGIGLLLTLKGPEIKQSVVEFLLKDTTDKTLSDEAFSESFHSSRGFLLRQQMENFRAAPVTGIGFGVPSEPMTLNINTGGPLGLPTSASVEKGFMPSAVLEETGLTGTALVIFFLTSLIRTVYANSSAPVFALLLASLLVNLGEAVFFSVGGMGLFFWVLIGLCYNLSSSGFPSNLGESATALIRSDTSAQPAL